MDRYAQCCVLGVIDKGERSPQQAKLWKTWNGAALVVAAVICSGVAGCAVTSEPLKCKFDGAEHRFDAKVNGMNLTARLLLDGQVIISHSWPPFVNSRDEQVAHVGDHEVRSVLRIIKGLGNTTAQIYVYMDGEQVGVFYF